MDFRLKRALGWFLLLLWLIFPDDDMFFNSGLCCFFGDLYFLGGQRRALFGRRDAFDFWMGPGLLDLAEDLLFATLITLETSRLSYFCIFLHLDQGFWMLLVAFPSPVMLPSYLERWDGLVWPSVFLDESACLGIGGFVVGRCLGELDPFLAVPGDLSWV